MANKNKILVTGASGQLGRRLVRELVSREFSVRAHYRSIDKADKYCPEGVERVYGDLLEPDWLFEACLGCDYVIHCAAWVSLRRRDEKKMRQINVEGTRHVIDAAITQNVKRMIHISTVAAVGAAEDGSILDESSEFNLGEFGIPYFITKQEAEKIALEVDKKELEVVVVNPSIMISPPDNNKKGSRRRLGIPPALPFYIDFGINLVQTEDVIEGILLALDRGRSGERYILAGHNIDANLAFMLTERYFGLKKPRWKLSPKVLHAAGAVVESLEKIKFPMRFSANGWKLSRNLARLAGLRFYYASDKARNEFNYRTRPLWMTIEEMLAASRDK